MKVLTDFHHAGLYNSLHLLFEKRLGWELYRPIGIDWFTNGFWRIAEPYGNYMGTIIQYLGTEQRKYEPYVFLNGDYKLDNENVYHIYDPENDIHHKAIEFSTFKKMEFDFIVPTYPLHSTWDALLEYQPKAKFIQQVGNENQITQARNILSSVYKFEPSSNQNSIFYHQEIDLKNFYYGEPNPESNKITSFVINLPEREVFLRYKSLLPEFEFRAYGPGAIDSTPPPPTTMGDTMREAKFGWHIKPADGFGHLLHSWFSVGRPVITKGNYYAGKTGGLLLEDGVTCIDLDKHSEDESAKLITYWGDARNYAEMCARVKEKFRSVVNYDEEAGKLKEWLSNII